MNSEFAEKVVLVTGAASGIGRACALRFAGAGARIAAVGRNEEALAILSREIGETSGKTLLLQADLSVAQEAELVVEQTIGRAGGIDVLVNAAGHIATGTIEDTSLEAWDAMLNINLRAVFSSHKRPCQV